MIEIGTYWRHKSYPQSPIKIIGIKSISGINNDIEFIWAHNDIEFIWAHIIYYCYEDKFLEFFTFDSKYTNEMIIKDIIE